MYVLALHKNAADTASLLSEMKKDGDYLISSRPTAVNLSWAVKRMLAKAEENASCDPEIGRAHV